MSGRPLDDAWADDLLSPLQDASTWDPVREALLRVVKSTGPVRHQDASVAIAAVEVVAHGLDRPTQRGSEYGVTPFIVRAGTPPRDLVLLASRALDLAGAESGELAMLWKQSGEFVMLKAWRASIASLRVALSYQP